MQTPFVHLVCLIFSTPYNKDVSTSSTRSSTFFRRHIPEFTLGVKLYLVFYL